MNHRKANLASLEEAIRHCRAALKALEAAERTFREGTPYPTYLQIAGVEMAHATETALQVALRSREQNPKERIDGRSSGMAPNR